MKRQIFGLVILALVASCTGGTDSTPLTVITGEIEQVYTVDWRGLPSNRTIAITTPVVFEQFSFVSIQDFDIQDAEQFLDPTVSAMFYDISGWDDVNSAGIFEVTISAVGNSGLPLRLTTFSITNLDNTVTLNNSQVELSKQVIYNATEGNVTLEGLTALNRTMIQGRISLEVEVAGRNVVLQSPDQFDIILTMELSALTRIEN